MSICPLNGSVFGWWPIAVKRAFTLSSEVSPVFTFFSRTPVTSFFATSNTSSTTEFQTISIFGCLITRSAMIFDARNWSRRWITYTFEANRVRNSDSSMAVSPPPTTATGTFRKKAPSHVAHADTPRPISFCSDSNPRYLAEAPVAMMTARASCVLPSSSDTFSGLPLKSTETTLAETNRVPNRAACFFISSISSGPMMPFEKPG